MRGEKDVEKVRSPMFPRLHVNDTEKGGPRAPPRNKMALYEQFSIPSQRFTSGSASILPRAQNSSCDMVSSTSSGQPSAFPNMFIPYRNTSVPPYVAEKLHHSSSSGGTKLKTTTRESENSSARPANNPNSNTTEPLLLAAESDLSQARSLSHSKSFSFELYANEEDGFIPKGITPRLMNDQESKERKSFPHVSLSSSPQHKSRHENDKSRHLVRNYFEENTNVSQTSPDRFERFSPVAVARDEDSEDKLPYPLTAASNFEQSTPSHSFLNQGNYGSKAVLDKALPGEEFMALRDKVTQRGDNVVEPARGMVEEISSKVRMTSESCLRQHCGDERSTEWLGNGIKCHEEKTCGTPVDRHDGAFEISMVDAVSDLNVCPDDIVGVIGERQFWKVRRTITYHQRIFAVQVFELHRLITVQKSIAGSPDMLHEDGPYLHKSVPKASPAKKIPSEYILESLAPIVKPKSLPNTGTECNQEYVARKLPLHSVNNNTGKGLVVKQSNYGEHLRDPPSAPTTTNKSVALPFHSPPPGNQWLVPVMSPSEGLVYKPYTGPCPPTAGFAVPNYGSCGPMSLNHGILAGTPPPLCQTYFPPPYGLPIMGPLVSNSAAEQISPLGVGRAIEQEYQSSSKETSFPKPHESSCNVSSQMSCANSCRGGAVQASKGGELQRSAAISRSERSRGDELPLFPVAPTAKEPDKKAQPTKHQTRVIKVLPHNPVSATESAARIFQSIQEERKHLRLVSS